MREFLQFSWKANLKLNTALRSKGNGVGFSFVTLGRTCSPGESK
ncbi:hypothetical protein [Campylobacter upsaliensis]|nr:hypothetical protein [Campylobacter upsaliensis]MCR2116097.1 hypothetical protein [Campylobacter upsaliensis]